MPAYNYFPVNYQPYNQNLYQPPFQQTQFQNPTAQPMQTSGIVWVSSDDEAAAYPIAPNNAVTLWHSSRPVVYVKQADASGKPSMKIYDLIEHKATQDVTPAPADAYATKSELEAISESIQNLKAEMKTIKKDIRKREVSDDDSE